MSIDNYRMNWAAIRKQAIDRHLESLRPFEKPPINIDAIVAALVIFAGVATLAFLFVYADDLEESRKNQVRTEYHSQRNA